MRPTDRRWIGAIFDATVAVVLAAIVSGAAVWLAVPLVSVGKRVLKALGVL